MSLNQNKKSQEPKIEKPKDYIVCAGDGVITIKNALVREGDTVSLTALQHKVYSAFVMTPEGYARQQAEAKAQAKEAAAKQKTKEVIKTK